MEQFQRSLLKPLTRLQQAIMKRELADQEVAEARDAERDDKVSMAVRFPQSCFPALDAEIDRQLQVNGVKYTRNCMIVELARLYLVRE